MLRRILFNLLLMLVIAVSFAAPSVVKAQSTNPAAETGPLVLFTSYPSQVIGFGDVVSFDLKLRTGTEPQIVRLEMKDLPEGWNATFRGSNKTVQSVYVQPGSDSTAELRLEQPKDLEAGTYKFTVSASSEVAKAELPLELTIQEKVPPRLTLSVELPTLKGNPTTTFRYTAALSNEGAEDMTVNLSAQTPQYYSAVFTLNSQEVTDLPLAAGESKSINIALEPLTNVPAGSYDVRVTAVSSTTQAALDLTLDVSGQASLTLTAPDGRLSGNAYAGSETPFKLVVQNTGSSSARNIKLTASSPTGWNVTFEPATIDEIPAGQQIEATAKITPAQKAIAGDYVVSLTASPADGSSKTAEFRITVLTSTLWGIAGIALIAVAVAVVGLAVARFGRR